MGQNILLVGPQTSITTTAATECPLIVSFSIGGGLPGIGGSILSPRVLDGSDR